MVLTHRLCAWALVILVTAHMGFTTLAYRSWSLGAAWFLGAGLGFVVLGFLNLVCGEGSPRRTVWYCFIGNVLGLAYAIAVASILVEPQALIGVALLLTLLGATGRRLVATRNTKVEAAPR